MVDTWVAHELSEIGSVLGAVHAPHSMLEFYGDPTSPNYRNEIGPEHRLILTGTSGGRSPLAATTLRQRGFSNVAHLDSGLESTKA